jgi:hypothetical protein
VYDYQQRPATPEYRDNWERIWGGLWSDPGEKALTQEEIEQYEPTYKNGCPVLESIEK